MNQILGLKRPARFAASFLFIIAAAVFALSTSSHVTLPHFSAVSVGVFILAILANIIMAGVRLDAIALRLGTKIGLLAALQANAAATVASQFIFAFLGQAAGRAVVLKRSGVSASTTITLSLLERVVAALVLGTAAVFAALFLFGRLTAGDDLDPHYFFRVLLCVLIAAGVALGTVYRGFLPLAAKGLLSRQVGQDLLVTGGLSVLVHMAMLTAYAALAIGLGAPLSAELIAACLVVMFAASLPISFGGWGVREISAGVALSLVGLSTFEGVAIGAAVGIASLAVQLGIAALSTARNTGASQPEKLTEAVSSRPDYPLWLSLLTPVLASFAIIFGLHMTVQGSVINLNLADPLAIVGGMLFLAYWLEHRGLPLWQPGHFRLVLVVLSCVVAFAALRGFLEFGYSNWGIRNRFLGWFVLLAFMATGALFVIRLGTAGREMLLKGFVAALCTAASLEILVMLLARTGLGIPNWADTYRFEGFSQNANAYAFLLLTGIAVIIALLRKGGAYIWALCGGVLLAALLFTSSRAGWGAAAIMFVAMGIIDRRMIRPLIDMILAGAIVVGFFLGSIAVIELVPQIWQGDETFSSSKLLRPFSAAEQSDSERLITLLGGWSLWVENPLLGAGLGAYVEQTGESGETLTIHNSFLWIAAEMGLVGLALFAAGGSYIFASIWKRLKNPADEAATTLFLLAVCFAAMSMVHDLLFQRILWFIAGICLALPGRKVG